MEQEVERLFTELVRGLKKQNFDLAAITKIINDGVTLGKGMAYCNENEVKSVLD